MDENRIKLFLNNDSSYNAIRRAARGTPWFMLGIIFFLYLVAMHDTPQHGMSYPLFVFLLLTLATFPLLRLLANRFFSEYLIIVGDTLILRGTRIDGFPERRFQLNELQTILWENEKLPLWGTRNSLFLIDITHKRHVIFKEQVAFLLTGGWHSFLNNLSALTSLPIERKYYVLSPDLKERCEVEQSSGPTDRDGGTKGLSRIYASARVARAYMVGYYVSVGTTTLLFSLAAAYYFSIRHFVLIGLVSICLCLTCTGVLLFISRNKKDMLPDDEKPIIIPLALTLVIPFFLIYSIFFVFFAFIFGRL